MHERRAPRLADDLRAHDDVPELARQPIRQLLARVDRERERVGLLVDAEVLALQVADLLRRDEREPELTVGHSLGLEHTAGELDGTVLVDAGAASVLDLDLDHQR